MTDILIKVDDAMLRREIRKQIKPIVAEMIAEARAEARVIVSEARAERERILGADKSASGVYSVEELAEILSCSTMHVYRLIEAGELQTTDIAVPGAGRSKTRIRAEDLADYLERHAR